MKAIQRSNSLWTAVFLALLVPIIVYAYEFGPPAAHTGAFGEPDCTECHFISGNIGVNKGPGSLKITAPADYTSGTTYPISVNISESTMRRWGFEMSVRTQDGKQAGTLKPGTDGFTQIATPPINSIQYIEHTTAGTRAGTANGVSFNFTWTAPDVSTGPIVFSAAGNASNNNNQQTGDHIYTTQVTVAPQAAGPTPAVFDNGTVNAASFAVGTNPLAPGGMATIFGTDLNDGSSITDSSFGSDGKLLSTLGGASVTFNGNAAPMVASFATQLSVQLPFELLGSTSAQVQVTVGGRTSVAKSVPIGAASPGMFTIPPGDQKPTAQGAIKISNTPIFAAPANSIPGAQARPANRGEFITIFCTGMGDVANRPVTGKPAPGGPLATTTITPQVSIGGIPATVAFSGLAPGFVALYQIDVQVPAAAPVGNAIPIVVSVGGVQANQVNIAVAAP